MNIYVASSWRNIQQPGVVGALRAAGHTVYDFRQPTPGDNGFHWSEIDPTWKGWSPEAFRAALAHPVAERGFSSDMNALMACDACVLVLPCGRSAHLELGWAVGAGKKTIILLAPGQEPELMYKMVDAVCLDLDEVIAALAPAGRVAPEHTRPHRGLKLTPKGAAAGCLLALRNVEGISAEAAALASALELHMCNGEPAAALLAEVRRLRELIGAHPFGEKVDRDVVPWFEAQAAATEERRTCGGCRAEIDPSTCWCGDPVGAHNGTAMGHAFVPMGCECHKAGRAGVF